MSKDKVASFEVAQPRRSTETLGVASASRDDCRQLSV
jgi:hypothetical protein